MINRTLPGDDVAWYQRGAPCEIDRCADRAHRWCRVCERRVCRNHRTGSGWWVLCPRCPRSLFVEIRRAWRDQAIEERRARVSCRACGVRFHQHGENLYLPACHCHRDHPRALFNGL